MDDFRAYAGERLDQITIAYRTSQSLPFPVDLMEGQLSQDSRLEFLTCIAISNVKSLQGMGSNEIVNGHESLLQLSCGQGSRPP